MAKWFYEQLYREDPEYLDPDTVPHALDTAVPKHFANLKPPDAAHVESRVALCLLSSSS